MIALSCAGVLILGIVIVVCSAIGLRMMARRKAESTRPPEDDAGW